MNNLNIIPIKNNVLLDVKTNDYKNQIINRIQSLAIDISKYRIDSEFLKLICNLTEHIVNKIDGIDKKALVIDVYNSLYCDLLDTEKEFLNNTIEFLHSNKYIKKLSFYKLFKTGISEFFKKRFR